MSAPAEPARPATAPSAAAKAAIASAAERPDALLRRLEWTVLRQLDGLLQGDHRTLFRGQGLDFADLRVYQPGDDPRHIDWNVTARLQEPHVRLYTEDREITAWFLVDLSASMDSGRDEGSARRLATELIAVLARVLTRQGCRVGAFIYRPQRAARRIDHIAAGGGRMQVLRLLDRLQPQPDAAAQHATALADLLNAGAASIRRRSLVFVLSDFISAPGWQTALGRLARRHDVLAVRLNDAVDELLPGLGWIRVEDAESGEQLQIDTDAPGFAARLRHLTDAREAELWAALDAAGADTLELSAGDDLLDALMRCVALRRRRPPTTIARRWHKSAPPLSKQAVPSASAAVTASTTAVAPARGAPT